MTASPSPPGPLAIRLRADIGELERLAEEVDGWAEFAGFDRAVAFHLNLALDELLTNTIRHGLDGAGEHWIEVALRLDGAEITVRITDDGIPFDPFTEAPLPDLDSELDDRSIGGLGVYLVRTFMDSVHYRREGDHNVVELTKSAAAVGR